MRGKTEPATTYQAVADYFIALSNETQNLISNLKLQKMVYYAQAWSLTILDRPLFDEDFQAWVHGPVLPALYAQYRHFTWKPIQREDLGEGALARCMNQFDEFTQQLLVDVAKEYFGLEPYHLERLTHSEEPWQKARNGLPDDEPSTAVISKEEMKRYYTQFIDFGQA